MDYVVKLLGEVYAALSLASLPIVLVALIGSIRPGLIPPDRAQAMVFLTLYALSYSLLSTALETAWQARYRVIIDPVIYVCAAYALSRLLPSPAHEISARDPLLTSR
jgi:hypothetical protein